MPGWLGLRRMSSIRSDGSSRILIDGIRLPAGLQSSALLCCCHAERAGPHFVALVKSCELELHSCEFSLAMFWRAAFRKADSWQLSSRGSLPALLLVGFQTGADVRLASRELALLRQARTLTSHQWNFGMLPVPVRGRTKSGLLRKLRLPNTTRASRRGFRWNDSHRECERPAARFGACGLRWRAPRPVRGAEKFFQLSKPSIGRSRADFRS